LGNVLDDNGNPISFANVILIKPQDSTIVKGTSTDDDGFFQLNAISENTYLFKISYIGFEEFFKELTVNQNLKLGVITLKEDVESLNEVNIVFKKPTLKKEADRLVFNVENTALIEGNMLQVLKSTPGVLVIDNNISVKNSTPTVYINNRKVNLSSSELSQLLEGSSANSIKSIEVITNPSAKYDASSGVVINIVMSKNLTPGYRGNVFANYTQGVFPIYNGGTGHFFKSEKVNFYSNYSYTDSKTNRDDFEEVNYLDSNLDLDQLWKSKTNRNKWTKTHTFNINFDYLINDKNTLSLSSNILLLPYFKYKKTNNTDVFDASENLDFYFDSNNLEQDKRHNLAFDLDYIHRLSKGELSFNAHYTDYDFKQDQGIISNYYNEDDTFIETTAFNTFNHQDTKIAAVKTDYSLPINNTSTFEAGLKASQVKTNSDTSQFDIINGQEVLDPNNTDVFDYKEDVYAAYVNYSKNWKKWKVILGLRTEQTTINSLSILNNSKNNQDYLEWFPTASISYNPTDKFSLYSSYKRSIERPNYYNLNPFQFFYNDKNSFIGNPNLKPEIEDHIIFGTSILNYFGIEAYFKKTNNNIYVLPRQDNTANVLTYIPLNFDSTIDYGLDLSVNFNVVDGWGVYFLTSFYNINDQTTFDNSVVEQNRWSNVSVFKNDLTFLKDRSLNANFIVYYFGKNLQGFRAVEDIWFSSFSISKSIFQKRAVISLSAEDIFNAQDFKDSTRYLNQFSSTRTNEYKRSIKLGFRYNFGNTNLKTNSRTKDLKERDRLKENN
jgi:outer membrane receptor protein involved in Fe transport